MWGRGPGGSAVRLRLPGGQAAWGMWARGLGGTMGWGRMAEGGWGSGVMPGVPPGAKSGKRDLAGCFPGQTGCAELRVSAGLGGEQEGPGGLPAGEEGCARAPGGLGWRARPAGSSMGNSHHGLRGVRAQPPDSGTGSHHGRPQLSGSQGWHPGLSPRPGTPKGSWALCRAEPGPPDGWAGVSLWAIPGESAEGLRELLG